MTKPERAPFGSPPGGRGPRRTSGAGAGAGKQGRADRAARPAAARDVHRRVAGPGAERAPTPPALPPDATPDRLDLDARRELRSLPKALADRVATHLVAAGLLVDDDPESAHAHALEARRLAARVSAVREAAGLTAYAAGRYGEALNELRAARRLADHPELLPVMADCERGLGRPERALALVDSPDARRLDRAGRMELLIVASGARRDMGQADAAVLTLEVPELQSGDVAEWTPRLWYAYAEALLAAGRRVDALEWFAAAAEVDDDDVTDAHERVAELEAGD